MNRVMHVLLLLPPPAFLGIICCLGVLSGSIPYGLLIAKTFCGIDPRLHGSKNIGTTNIARLCGKKWGLLTFLCDVLKGAVPVACAIGLSRSVDELSMAPSLAGLGAILGHMYSPWLKFKGGKGVATTMGVFLTLCPLPFLIAASLCLIGIMWSGYVSVGSLVLSISLPVVLSFFGSPYEACLATLVGLVIILAHRENIRRLLSGQEKTWKKKTKFDKG